MNPQTHPRVFVISAPSGVGKSTIIHWALAQFPGRRLSVSVTTRPARPGEEHGRDYHFTDREAFAGKVKAGEFLEWATVFDNYYGTSASEVAGILADGRHALLDVDVQGAESIKAAAEGVTYIFIMPPSMEALRSRLRSRGTESEQSLAKRLEKAEFEAGHAHMYDRVIVNDDAERATGELVEFIHAEGKTAVPFVYDPSMRGRASRGEREQEDELVEKVARDMRSGLREEMISLINSRVRTALDRDLARLILEALQEYNRRDC